MGTGGKKGIPMLLTFRGGGFSGGLPQSSRGGFGEGKGFGTKLEVIFPNFSDVQVFYFDQLLVFKLEVNGAEESKVGEGARTEENKGVLQRRVFNLKGFGCHPSTICCDYLQDDVSPSIKESPVGVW